VIDSVAPKVPKFVDMFVVELAESRPAVARESEDEPSTTLPSGEAAPLLEVSDDIDVAEDPALTRVPSGRKCGSPMRSLVLRDFFVGFSVGIRFSVSIKGAFFSFMVSRRALLGDMFVALLASPVETNVPTGPVGSGCVCIGILTGACIAFVMVMGADEL